MGSVTDQRALSAAFLGADAVVHLAADPRPEAPWESTLHSNIDGTYQAFEAARQQRVGRFIFASSNRVTGLRTEQGIAVSTAEIAPDSVYAASKVFGEALGRLYSERFGMTVICLRIGYLNAEDDPYAPLPDVGPAVVVPSPEDLAAVWISHRDMTQLVQRSLEVTGISFGVFYGVSGRSGSLWDISDARDILGYEPADGEADCGA